MKTSTLIPRICLLVLVSTLVGIASAGALPPAKIYSNEAVEHSEPYEKGNDYQRDMLLFFDMLSSVHPAFAPNHQSPFDVEEARKEGYEWAADCPSQEALSAKLQGVISHLNDGHTLISPSNYQNSLFHPFQYFTAGGKFYLETVTRLYENSLGKEIVKINGAPINDVVESFRPSFSCENAIDYRKQVRYLILIQTLWTHNPYRRGDGMLVLTFGDGSEIALEAVGREQMDLVRVKQTATPVYSIMQNTRAPFSYQIIEERSICYLQFSSCMDQSTVRFELMNNNQGLSKEQIEQRLAKLPRFDAFLAGMFAQIAAKKIRTLVVDVRNNGGGNSELCKMLLSWLKPLNDTRSGGGFIRVSAFWEQWYPTLVDRYRLALENRGEEYQLGELYDLDSFSKEDFYAVNYDALFPCNEDVAKIFGGNVIIFQNAGTYSSAGILVVDAVDNVIGIVAGGESSFRPCNYGDALIWKLPNTGLEGFISHKYFTRPEASRCGEASIVPAIKIDYTLDDVLAGEDIHWKWVMENY